MFFSKVLICISILRFPSQQDLENLVMQSKQEATDTTEDTLVAR